VEPKSPRRRAVIKSHRAYSSGMMHDILPAALVAIDSLTPDPANVRLHPDHNLDAIKASLKRFGQQKPIVADAAGIIRAGNGTWAAAKALGWERIWAVTTTLSGGDAAAFAIADNRTAELAQWDTPALASQLAALDAHLQLAAGFTPEEMAALTADIADAAVEDAPDLALRQVFEIAVQCEDEDDQREVYERLTGEGRQCRVMTI
jgi:ParB-like chromosome segregation protein Spo0J